MQQVASNYAFLFRNKENKILLPPPPPKKRLRDTNGRNMAICTSVCQYQQTVTWIFTRSRLSNPFNENYYLIIVVFSRPHFSIYDNFHTKENTQSFNVMAPQFTMLQS